MCSARKHLFAAPKWREISQCRFEMGFFALGRKLNCFPWKNIHEKPKKKLFNDVWTPTLSQPLSFTSNHVNNSPHRQFICFDFCILWCKQNHSSVHSSTIYPLALFTGMLTPMDKCLLLTSILVFGLDTVCWFTVLPNHTNAKHYSNCPIIHFLK